MEGIKQKWEKHKQKGNWRQNSFIMDACSQGEKMQERWKRDARSLDPWVQECSLVEKVYGEIERNEEQKRAQVFQGSESATQFSATRRSGPGGIGLP